MQNKSNFFVINDIWTPTCPNDDILDNSLTNNLKKPMLEMSSAINDISDQSNTFEETEEDFESSTKKQLCDNNSQHNTQNKSEEKSPDPLCNYRSVRINPFNFTQNSAEKSIKSINNSQQQQSSASIQFNSIDKNQTEKSINSLKSSQSQNKNDISVVGKDISISLPQLTVSKSISVNSIRKENNSPPVLSNGIIFRKKNSITQSKLSGKKQNSRSSSDSESANSSDSEKRDTLPSQMIIFGKEKEQAVKKEATQSDDDSQYDSFTIRMNSLSKLKMGASQALGQFNGGEITQIKISKDVFSTNQSASSSNGSIKQKNHSQYFESPPHGGNYRPSIFSQKYGLNQIAQNYGNRLINVVKQIKMRMAVKRMVDKTSSRRLQKLDEKHLKYIGDLSIFKSTDKKIKKLQKKWYQRLFKRYMKFPTFNPYSIYKMIWDIFMLFVTFFYFIAIPLLLSTGDEFNELFGEFPYYVPSILLTVDAFIHMNTGYYRNGSLVVAKNMILNNYAKKLLTIDVIGIAPIFIYTISPSTTLKYFLILYFIKYKSITKIFKRLELRLDLKSSLLNFIALLKLLFTVLFIAHFFANFWMYLVRMNPEQNWYKSLARHSDLWYYQYMTAYYYVTVTMVTVGYGDITPTNYTERFFAVITILLACGVFAYSVNAIGFILDEINREQKLLNKNMQIINQYMDKKNISRELRFQIRDYLEFFWRQQNVGNVELEQKIISQLAHNLKEKLFVEANRLILKENKVFSNKFSERVLMKTLSIVKEYRFTPQQIIFQRNQQDDSSIYFIESGTVEIYIENDKNQNIISIHKLSKGQYFGEISFYTGLERKLSVRSVDFATLLKIEREDFLNILKMYPRDLELFHSIKDQVLFSNNYGQIGVSCFSCLNSDHLMEKCPMVQFVPNKLYCYKRHNFNPGQKRLPFKRILKDKYSTLKDIDLLKGAAENIQEDYEELMPTTDTSISELSCIEDVGEEEEEEDDEPYKQTPRQKPLINGSQQKQKAQIFQYQMQYSPLPRRISQIRRDSSPLTPSRRKTVISQLAQLSPNNDIVIDEDPEETDSQYSNNRQSVDFKNDFKFDFAQNQNDQQKKIKFSILDINDHSNTPKSPNSSNNDSPIENQTNELDKLEVPKLMLTNQTIKQSRFSKKKQRRESSISCGYEKNQIDEQLNDDIAQDYYASQFGNTKDSMSSGKNSLASSVPHLQNAQSSSISTRRFSTKRNSQLSFSQQFALSQGYKKEYPRIAQLRKEQTSQNTSTQLSSSSSQLQNQTQFSNYANQNNYTQISSSTPRSSNHQLIHGLYNDNGGNNYNNNQTNMCSTSYCNQCQYIYDQNAAYKTSKNNFKQNNDYNNNDNLQLQYGSLLVVRPKNNSTSISFNNQSSSSNLQRNSIQQNINTTLNYSQSNTSNRNSMTQTYPIFSSRRNSRLNHPLHICGDQLVNLQHHIRNHRHKDSISSSNSPRSRRHPSFNSAKYSKIEVAFNTDQLVRKINAIYDKLYTEVSKEGEKEIIELDKQKDYEIYFPKFNLSQVLKRQKEKKKLTQINRFINAFNVSRGQSQLDEGERTKGSSISPKKLNGRSTSAIYNNIDSGRSNTINPLSPQRNKSARNSIFIPFNGQGGQQVKGLKFRPSLNSDVLKEIKLGTDQKSMEI